MHTLYFLGFGNCVMGFLLGCETYSKSQRQQCKCLEADRYIKLEKGLRIVNKAQGRILG